MEKKYITYEQAAEIAMTGLWDTENLTEEDAVYYDCPDRNLKAVPSIIGQIIEQEMHGVPSLEVCPLFTYDEAVRWLRESAGIHIQMNSVERKRWSYDLCDLNEWQDEDGAYHSIVPERDGYPVFNSFDEAVSDAIDKAVAIFAPVDTDDNEPQIPLMSEEGYNKFCADSESMEVYDGRGKYDLYECESCASHVFTTYADKGVTPFVIRCRKCGGTMKHTRTFNAIPAGEDVVKWVRPTYAQYCELSKQTFGICEHINNGGLVLETNLIK